MNDNLALLRLLQLASPALPVGAYTYSQGVEWAVESGLIHNEATTLAWIGGVLENSIGLFEAPLLARLHTAWLEDDQAEAWRLNAEFLSSRETGELRAETVQMGYSLRRLAGALPNLPLRSALDSEEEIAFPTVWAAMAAAWEIPIPAALAAYLWSWCEGQILAAVKTVPLGQSAGQRLLVTLGGHIPAVVTRALTLPEDAWSNFAPGFAIASSRHEIQYCRLFRS